MQFKDEPISFKINDKENDPAEEVTLHFKFMSDGSGIRKIDFDRISNHEATYILHNFENDMGSLLDHPLEVGMINDKVFYLVFVVSRANPKMPIAMTYTWYMEKEKRSNA